MKLKIIIILLTFLKYAGYSQTIDSIGIIITKKPDSIKGYSLYHFEIKNLYFSPVCIIHSAYINLFEDPPQVLALFKKDTNDIFSLAYTARDTLNNYENTNPNRNGEVILPLQSIRFSLLIPDSKNERQLEFELFNLKEYCYQDFRNRIFANATNWYQQYTPRNRLVKLPIDTAVLIDFKVKKYY